MTRDDPIEIPRRNELSPLGHHPALPVSVELGQEGEGGTHARSLQIPYQSMRLCEVPIRCQVSERRSEREEETHCRQ